MNLELRTQILEYSLILEDYLSAGLAMLFRIKKDKQETKTLGGSTSSISLKTKADLLNDLGRITSEQYTDLIIFMEIRNQLIHNKGVDSLEKAVAKTSRLKRLLELVPDRKEQYTSCMNADIKEQILMLTVTSLFDGIIKSVESMIEVIREEVEDENNSIKEDTLNQVSESMAMALAETSIKIDQELMVHTTNSRNIVQKYFYPIFFGDLKKKFPEAEADLSKQLKSIIDKIK